MAEELTELGSKLADWDDDDPAAVADTTTKWDKLAILKHMFTLKEIEEDPSIVLDLKEDIRDECEKLGEITNVVLYDKEEDGVVTIKFKEVAGAQACVEVGDFIHRFGPRELTIHIAYGRTVL